MYSLQFLWIVKAGLLYFCPHHEDQSKYRSVFAGTLYSYMKINFFHQDHLTLFTRIFFVAHFRTVSFILKFIFVEFIVQGYYK